MEFALQNTVSRRGERPKPVKYILVLDVRYVKILDHENPVQNDLKFSSSQSII